MKDEILDYIILTSRNKTSEKHFIFLFLFLFCEFLKVHFIMHDFQDIT